MSLETKKTYAIIDHPLNKQLISRLKQNGEEVLIFPSLKTSGVEIKDRAVEFIKNPSTNFDWIIFTDVFAADYFIAAMREQATDFFELDALTVCALGEAVADRLRYEHIHADVIPPNSADESIFSAISQYASGEISDLSFLVLREMSKIFGFVEMLKSKNASIADLPIYRSVFENELELTKLKTLLKGGAIDEFIFSSAEETSALKMLYADENLAGILNEIKVFATNEVAFQTLQENGLRPLYFHDK